MDPAGNGTRPGGSGPTVRVFEGPTCLNWRRSPRRGAGDAKQTSGYRRTSSATPTRRPQLRVLPRGAEDGRRPNKKVDARTEDGHREGGLIICKRTRPVLVLHERKSSVTLAAWLAGKTAEIISVMLAVFARVEPALRKFHHFRQ